MAWHSHGGAALLQSALDKCWPPRRQRVKDQALPTREMKPKYPLLLRGEVTLFSACTAGSCPGKDDSLRSPPGLTVGLAGLQLEGLLAPRQSSIQVRGPGAGLLGQGQGRG